MKKKYISPKIDVMCVEALCSSFRVASVYKGSLKGECIGSFKVVDEQVTKTDGVGGGFSKPHEFTDDSFDNTAWPKSKSPWED